ISYSNRAQIAIYPPLWVVSLWTHRQGDAFACRIRPLLGKFHIPRKVGNSFLGQGTIFRHCPLYGSLYLRLCLTRRPCVRLFLRATRSRSVAVLCQSGVRSGLSLRACRAQNADDYAHTRTAPTSPDPLARGRSPAAVAEQS